MCSLSTVMMAWDQTQQVAPTDSTQACRVPSPTDFEYPDHYSVQAMAVSAGFVPAADRWVQGTDDLSAVSSGWKYAGGVLLPDGRVLLVPADANHVGLYDAGGTRNGAAYTVAALAPADNTLLLPYYNKL